MCLTSIKENISNKFIESLCLIRLKFTILFKVRLSSISPGALDPCHIFRVTTHYINVVYLDKLYVNLSYVGILKIFCA